MAGGGALVGVDSPGVAAVAGAAGAPGAVSGAGPAYATVALKSAMNNGGDPRKALRWIKG